MNSSSHLAGVGLLAKSMSNNRLDTRICAAGLVQEYRESEEEVKARDEFNKNFEKNFDLEKVSKAVYNTVKIYKESFLNEESTHWDLLPDGVKDNYKRDIWNRTLDFKAVFDNSQGAMHYAASYNPIDELAKVSHNNWLTKKLKDGYRLGEITDHELKTQTLLLPYDELTPEGKYRSIAFINTIKFYFDLVVEKTARDFNEKMMKDYADNIVQLQS